MLPVVFQRQNRMLGLTNGGRQHECALQEEDAGVEVDVRGTYGSPCPLRGRKPPYSIDAAQKVPTG